MTIFDPKEILDKYATEVLLAKNVVVDPATNKASPNANNSFSYMPHKYDQSIVLWKAPNDWIRIEFDGVTGNEAKILISETESNLRSRNIQYCITYHDGGVSPYINVCNIKNIPLNENNRPAKILFLAEILSKQAFDKLDKSNLSFKFTPVIGHAHWKPKYNGAIHKLVKGINPLEQVNEYPKEFLKTLKESRKKIEKSIKENRLDNKWTEDFLLNYCCSNFIEKGNRHNVISKNLAILVAFRNDCDEIVQSYLKAQQSSHNDVHTWISAVIQGKYHSVSAGELYKFIKDNKIPYEVPKLTVDENKDSGEISKTSLFIDNDYMYEQIRRDNKNLFIKYSFADETMEDVDCIPGEKSLFPIDDEEVAGGHIKLPSAAEEYESEEKLIFEIETHVKKYLDVPDDYLHYAALNILKSWVYERFASLNYLRVQGEPGSGKSRFLHTIGGLHYKPIATSGAATVSPIFRLINKWGCTLIMDEADIKQSDETNELIKIINQGFEKGSPVIRCNPENKTDVEFFNVYCPKVLSTRHSFEDLATESRCMTQVMSGTTRTDIISSLNDVFHQEQQLLRNKLLLWRFRNYNKIEPDIGESIDWTGIEPRLRQVNVGFIALLQQDKEYIKKFMERIKSHQTALREERSESIEGQIVGAISKLIIQDRPITAKAIVDFAELKDSKGNTWKPRKVAPYMKTLGFLGTKVIRVDDTTEKEYQYNPNSLAFLLKRYLSEDDFSFFVEQIKTKQKNLKNVYHVTIVTIVTGIHTIQETDNKDDKISNKKASGGCHRNNGNNGNTVTEVNGYNGYTAKNKIDKLLESGDLMETQPGVYRKVM